MRMRNPSLSLSHFGRENGLRSLTIQMRSQRSWWLTSSFTSNVSGCSQKVFDFLDAIASLELGHDCMSVSFSPNWNNGSGESWVGWTWCCWVNLGLVEPGVAVMWTFGLGYVNLGLWSCELWAGVLVTLGVGMWTLDQFHVDLWLGHLNIGWGDPYVGSCEAWVSVMVIWIFWHHVNLRLASYEPWIRLM